jgi:hypothetical protein
LPFSPRGPADIGSPAAAACPEGIRTLNVGVFENQTRESGLEHQIANEVIHQFTRFGTVGSRIGIRPRRF